MSARQESALIISLASLAFCPELKPKPGRRERIIIFFMTFKKRLTNPLTFFILDFLGSSHLISSLKVLTKISD